MFGRFFKELQIGFKAIVSFQASNTHSCKPEETLDDIYAYEEWEVGLRQINKPIDIPHIGIWGRVQEQYLGPRSFDRPEFQRSMVGEFVTTEEAQQVYEDVLDYAIRSDHIKVRGTRSSWWNRDAELKKLRACTGCSGSK